MIIKRTLKFMLCAVLLAVSGSAFAQGDGEDQTPQSEDVQLANGTKISWSKFVGVINNPSSLSVAVDSTAYLAAQKAYTDALKEAASAPDSLKAATTRLHLADSLYNQANDSLTALNAQKDDMTTSQKEETVVVVPTWLETAYNGANTLQSRYSVYLEALDDGISAPASTTTNLIWMKYGSASGTLTISFEDPKASGYSQYSVKGLYDFISKTTTDGSTLSNPVTTVRIYMGKNAEGVNNYGEADGLGVYICASYLGQDRWRYLVTNVVTDVKTLYNEEKTTKTQFTKAYQDLLNAIKAKTDRVKALNAKKSAAQTAYNKASAAVTNSTSNVSTTKAAYDEATTALNKAVAEAGNAINDYLDVTLVADIEASTPVTKAYNGSINADGHMITVANGVNLFGTNYFSNAQLHNAIINGVFATGGKYYNVAAWRGANGIYYDENGNNGGTITNIGKLAYDNRDLRFFSADIAGKKLVKWASDNQVYDVTLYQPDATTQFYTNVANNVFTNNPIEKVSANAFYVSKTDDFGAIPNVIVDNVCADVQIEDKESFYCPMDITAKNVTLKRSLNQGYNTVCLPFEMTHENMGLGDNDLLCVYDTETADKFWFNKTQTVPANTPALIYLSSAAKSETTLSGVTIKATDKSQRYYYEGDAEDKSQACGLFAKTTPADMIKGASKSVKIYGLQGGNSATPKFNPASSGTFYAFRMVLVSEIAGTQALEGMAPMSRAIGVVDEKGIEINVGGGMSALEVVDMESASLEITAGHNEIIITTDANYGMQTVYSIDGKAVATVNVVEGTNTVSVRSGVYVVMGEKVMVK